MPRWRRGDDEFWSEEAGRRFAAQQEELVGLRERNAYLETAAAEGGLERLQAQVRRARCTAPP